MTYQEFSKTANDKGWTMVQSSIPTNKEFIIAFELWVTPEDEMYMLEVWINDSYIIYKYIENQDLLC